MDGTGLRLETLDHSGEYPDTVPQAIKLIDAEGRSCIYAPITQDGKVVRQPRVRARFRGGMIDNLSTRS
jgi:hypothetical protein